MITIKSLKLCYSIFSVSQKYGKKKPLVGHLDMRLILGIDLLKTFMPQKAQRLAPEDLPIENFLTGYPVEDGWKLGDRWETKMANYRKIPFLIVVEEDEFAFFFGGSWFLVMIIWKHVFEGFCWCFLLNSFRCSKVGVTWTEVYQQYCWCFRFFPSHNSFVRRIFLISLVCLRWLFNFYHDKSPTTWGICFGTFSQAPKNPRKKPKIFHLG